MTSTASRSTLTGRRSVLAALLGASATLLGACAVDPASPTAPVSTPPPTPRPTPTAVSSAPPSSTASAAAPQKSIPSRQTVVAAHAGKPAGAFGLEIPGIKLGLPPGARGAALTFDACGGKHGAGYDAKLIAALRKHQAPATLFINSRWAQTNASLLRELIADPLFEIANHGTSHAPLTSRGQAAYGIPGTKTVGEAYDEVVGNQHYLADEFGVEAKFFRSGTAHMDELGAAICRDVGLIPMNFTINLDAGATFPLATVAAQTMQLGAADVGIAHFNQPSSATSAGVARALPGLIEKLESKNLRLLTLSAAFA
ncbi:MAG: polysaccharide deacetylase family protein [Paeniglutamicibacter terrestris]